MNFNSLFASSMLGNSTYNTASEMALLAQPVQPLGYMPPSDM